MGCSRSTSTLPTATIASRACAFALRCDLEETTIVERQVYVVERNLSMQAGLAEFIARIPSSNALRLEYVGQTGGPAT
jgi:tagatose-1,6-bisphosphate aldolase non-catalytic subunit AgaZ/GatZ